MEKERRRGYHASWCSFNISSHTDLGLSIERAAGGRGGSSCIWGGDLGSEKDDLGVSKRASSFWALGATISAAHVKNLLAFDVGGVILISFSNSLVFVLIGVRSSPSIISELR